MTTFRNKKTGQLSVAFPWLSGEARPWGHHYTRVMVTHPDRPVGRRVEFQIVRNDKLQKVEE